MNLGNSKSGFDARMFDERGSAFAEGWLSVAASSGQNVSKPSSLFRTSLNRVECILGVLLALFIRRLGKPAGFARQWFKFGRVLVTVLTVGLAPYAYGQQFTADGVIKSKFYDASEKLHATTTYHFEVEVSNCLWRIEVEPVSFWSTVPSTFGNTDNVFSATYDGENIYLIHDMSRWVKIQKRIGNTVGGNIANAVVVKSDVPRDPFAEGIGSLWLTFASSCYFQNRTDDKIAPMFCSASGVILPEQVVKEKAVWHLSDAFSLPDRLTMFSDGTPLSFRRLASGYKLSRYAPPYDKGFMLANFEVTAFTNCDRMKLPRSATFTTFGPKPTASNKGDLRTVVEHQISCTAVSEQTTLGGGPPKVPGETSVMEERFLGEKVIAFSYRVRDRLLTDSEVRERPEYKKVKRVGWVVPKNFISTSDTPVPTKKRLVVLALLVVPLALGIFLYLRWERKSKKT